MLLIRRQGIIFTAVLIILLVGAGHAMATALSSVTVTALSLIPGQETRYIVKFSSDTELDLSKRASITVEFPAGFKIIYNDILAADPGAVLTRLEFKNPEDKAFAVVRGTTSVAKRETGVQCSFTPQPDQLIIPAQTNLYLIIPGVVNPSAGDRTEVKLYLCDARGDNYQGSGSFSLGLPPSAAVQHVRLAEATSSKIRLDWDPVPGATRYKVVYSSQPDGEYISALDFSRDPFPGEDWQLTETTHSFTARGNGGLSPGGIYYFKVLAGNDYGFGPGSAVLRVTLPEIKLLNSKSENQKVTTNSADYALVARLDQPVQIINPDAIGVYEKASGRRVKKVQAAVDETNNNLIRISFEMRPGTEYLIVFHEGALESRIQPNVVNNTMGWTVAVSGGR